MFRLKTNASFFRKEPDLPCSPCIIEKVIPLSASEFDYFSTNLLQDYNFIAESAGLMRRDKDGAHCLLVYSEDRPDGILVESEGHSYARYAALLPNVTAFLLAQKGGETLAALNARLIRRVDYMVERCLHCDPDSPSFAIQMDELENRFGFGSPSEDTLINTTLDMLLERPEVESVDFEDGTFILRPSASAIETARATAGHARGGEHPVML